MPSFLGGVRLNRLLRFFATVAYYGPKSQYWFLDFWKQPYGWKLSFASWEMFPIALALCKMSILFFYQRVFEGKTIRRLLLGTHVFNILLALSYFIAEFFVQTPLECQFYLFPESHCHTHDVWDGSGAYSAVNASFDVWLVAMPAFIIWRLNMMKTRRLKTIGLFATGIM